MTTVAEVLQKYQVGMSEADLAVGLETALRGLPGPGAAALTVGEVDYLEEHAGPGVAEVIGAWDPQVEREARARSVVAAVEEVVSGSVGIAHAAQLLGVDRSRISHRLSAGVLYAVTVGSQRRIPTWQFERAFEWPSGERPPLVVPSRELPGLAQVVGGIPATAHPLDVAGVMTTPADELAGRTPVEHLASGGDPSPVVDLLGELDRW